MDTSYLDQNYVLVSFRCPESLKAQVEEMACSCNFSKSEIIRNGVEILMYIVNNPDPIEKMKEGLCELRLRFSAREHAPASLPPVPEESSAIFSCIERRDANMRNIIRLNKCYNGVDGFRVTIAHIKRKFERTFYDKEYGGVNAAFKAATAVRDYVRNELELLPTLDQIEVIYAEGHAMMPPLYPRRKRRSGSLLQLMDKQSSNTFIPKKIQGQDASE